MKPLIFLSALLAILYESGATSELRAPESYRVATVVDPPFMYENPNCTSSVEKGVKKNRENDCYHGFMKDLLLKIAEELKFNFTVESVDTEYGSLDKGVWNGLIGTLKNKAVDIGLAAFEVTSEREAVIDFSNTFFVQVGDYKMNYAIGFSKDSKLTKSFSQMIRKLTNQRYIEQLVEVWWTDNPDMENKKYDPSIH